MKATWLVGAVLALPLVAAAQPGGDAQRGRTLYESRCIACHSPDASRAGPAHRGVVGRRAGSVRDYAYSAALAKANIVWNANTLDAWLASPEALVPGQLMGLQVENARDRADLIAYLATLR